MELNMDVTSILGTGRKLIFERYVLVLFEQMWKNNRPMSLITLFDYMQFIIVHFTSLENYFGTC